VLQKKFFVDPEDGKIDRFNLIDLFIVVFCSIDHWVLSALGDGSGNLSFMRLIRLVRLSRGLKVIRVMKAFSKLRILLRTVGASFMALAWSMVLLGLLMFAGAVLLCQMLLPSLDDTTLEAELRIWIFDRYGTTSRALWTMFEVTFSGGWPNYARRLVEEVHYSFAFVYAIYASVVVFAVTRIITALFLKDTLQVAANDADMMIQESAMMKKQYAAKLHELFLVADTSVDGKVSFEEFKALCDIPEVRTYLHLLELDIDEAHGLFRMLDGGTGEVSLSQFTAGIMRLKGQARSLDVIAVMRDTDLILHRLTSLQSALSQVAEFPALGPDTLVTRV